MISDSCVDPALDHAGCLEGGHETWVSAYWPGFTGNGTEVLTVREVVSRHAWIPQMPAGIRVEWICDWDYMIAAIADMRRSLVPGENRTPWSARWVSRFSSAPGATGLAVTGAVATPLLMNGQMRQLFRPELDHPTVSAESRSVTASPYRSMPLRSQGVPGPT